MPVTPNDVRSQSLAKLAELYAATRAGTTAKPANAKK
jgi:hypothetical protein